MTSIDSVTSRVSPEYFVAGKGVNDGGEFTQSVLLLGAHAGFFAGAVAASCYLFANNPGKGLPTLPYRTLSWLALIPVASAAIGGMLIGFSLSVVAGPSLAPVIAPPVEPEDAKPFVVVWGTHAGVYLGLLVGVVLGVVSIRRSRRRLPAPATKQATDPQFS